MKNKRLLAKLSNRYGKFKAAEALARLETETAWRMYEDSRRVNKEMEGIKQRVDEFAAIYVLNVKAYYRASMYCKNPPAGGSLEFYVKSRNDAEGDARSAHDDLINAIKEQVNYDKKPTPRKNINALWKKHQEIEKRYHALCSRSAKAHADLEKVVYRVEKDMKNEKPKTRKR